MKSRLFTALAAFAVILAARPAAASGYQPVTVDNYGRKVTVTSMPQRVLTFGPNCSELFVALGLGSKIAGNTLDNHSRGPLPEYAAEYAKIPELNYGSATREAVLTSGADFVFGIDWEFGGAGLDIAELEACGMNVLVEKASNFDEIYGEIRALGKIFKIEERAEKFIKEQESRIAAVASKLKGREPLRVLVYDSGSGGVFTCSGGNFESLLIERAGGRNIFADLGGKQWATVSYEEVIERAPQVIVVHDYDSPSVEQKIAEIKANSALSQLECVKNGRFVAIALESVLPGSRMAYAVERLAAGFYPEIFAGR
ncbi:ABC transporter substrate-binding protein [Cloacibacillus sp. An23]|uniref:ABC transporter substrate-binding protein n=1 Tax=Cloacibacillus sp. An23 TaxID=1965591 RepID=UPI000B38CE24|nr:ABC transporter substrate-binding protein [Cloacibacillus sp. An23]OUO92807.1 iron ABC transporter substrate-binding protein [Cloacibacillus sp. An23]